VGFPLFQMIAMGMVDSMAAGPGEIRYEQQTVQDETYRTFKLLIRMEGIVATFVANYPQSHHHSARDDAIEEPKRNCPKLKWNLGSNSIGQDGKA
jgi:hypothetical protein